MKRTAFARINDPALEYAREISLKVGVRPSELLGFKGKPALWCFIFDYVTLTRTPESDKAKEILEWRKRLQGL